MVSDLFKQLFFGYEVALGVIGVAIFVGVLVYVLQGKKYTQEEINELDAKLIHKYQVKSFENSNLLKNSKYYTATSDEIISQMTNELTPNEIYCKLFLYYIQTKKCRSDVLRMYKEEFENIGRKPEWHK